MLSAASRTLLRSAAPRTISRRTMFTHIPTHRYEPVPITRILGVTAVLSATVVAPMWLVAINGAGAWGL